MAPIVYVAVLSYKRPDAVPGLLEGLASLRVPDGWETHFLIVDNDAEESARAPVEAAMAGFGGRLSYVVEPEPGIPAARNRALREGLDAGAELLCFIDDDERPDPDWLAELIEHRRRTGALLIGGPLRRSLPAQGGTLFQRLFGRSLIARRRIAELRAARRAAAGKPVPVYTSNWMCDLSLVRDRGLWFDGGMIQSGGSDAAFYLAAREQGAATSWCASAIVSEPISLERMTIGYQFGRSRAQGIVSARLHGKTAPSIFAEQAPRALAGMMLMAVPLIGIASFATGLHLVAAAAGHFAYLRGKQSALYARREAAA